MTYLEMMNPGKGNNPRQINQMRVQTSSFEVKSAHPSKIKGLRRFGIWRIYGLATWFEKNFNILEIF